MRDSNQSGYARNVASPPARGLDHLVLAVSDLESARDFYTRLGFTLTPRARHPFGTDNSLAQLQGSFLELLSVARPAEIPPHGPDHFSFAAYNRDFLARRQGFSMLVFESRDARADHDELRSKGIRTYAPFNFSRPAKLPDGAEVTVGFSLTFVSDPRWPDCAMFVCQQHAPEHFWKPDFQRHANGAVGIEAVYMVAADPMALAGHFAALQGPDAVAPTRDGLDVATARGRVRVLEPAAFAARFPGARIPNAPTTPYYAGFRLALAEPGRVPAALGGVELRKGAGSRWIDPTQAFGCLIEFAA
ncbi:MAG: VOC family protein [Rhodospirillales bacterium]|nr:VOC family protein [Rhodospirillales bacterium]MSP79756.1 VOC family protein [Rhodospirillales bacterium]